MDCTPRGMGRSEAGVHADDRATDEIMTRLGEARQHKAEYEQT